MSKRIYNPKIITTMKKYFILTVVALLTTTGVNAQNEEGDWSIMPKAGWNLTTWANDPDAKMMSGYMAGLEAEYGLTEKVGFVAGIQYSLQGEKGHEVDGNDSYDYKYMFGYTNIPLMVQFYPVKGLAIKAGAQLGFLTSKKVTVNGVKLDIDKMEAITGLPSEFRKFDIAIPLGISYEYQHFVLDARYNLGLLGIVKGYDKTIRNSVFQLSLGYKFTLAN